MGEEIDLDVLEEPINVVVPLGGKVTACRRDHVECGPNAASMLQRASEQHPGQWGVGVFVGEESEVGKRRLELPGVDQQLASPLAGKQAHFA